MIRCNAMDCQFINRKMCLCKFMSIEVDARKGCMTYKMDMEYLRMVWHRDIHASLKSKGYVPETQEMVDIAKSLISHSKPKAGEEART